MVGTAGLEPTASATPRQRSARLSYVPIEIGLDGRIRTDGLERPRLALFQAELRPDEMVGTVGFETHSLLDPNQALYQIELRSDEIKWQRERGSNPHHREQSGLQDNALPSRGDFG
jgi:hypothetical protein